MNVKLLMITAGNNLADATIRTMPDIDYFIINCYDASIYSLHEIRNFVISSISHYYETKGIPDLMITYRCPCLIPKSLFEKPKLGAFNIHPSLLPKYPGLNPWNEIFRNHDWKTGVTLHQMTEHIDSGLIVSQSLFLIDDSDTIDSARMKSDIEAAKIIERFILDIQQSI